MPHRLLIATATSLLLLLVLLRPARPITPQLQYPLPPYPCCKDYRIHT